MTFSEIKQMQVGQVVDFCISYNERQKAAEKQDKKKDKKRLATQTDINNFFG